MRNSPKSRIYLETLEEIADSDQLMDAFADETERYYFIPAPNGFSVLKKSRSLDVQVTVKTRQASRKLQLLRYSLQVGTAVAGALFLLFSLSESSLKSMLDLSYYLFKWR